MRTRGDSRFRERSDYRKGLRLNHTFRAFQAAGLAALLSCSLFVFGWRVVASARSAQDDAPAARAKRGKQIYERGTSTSGREILAYVGDSSVEVPGSAMPCANCHGLDGLGKPEAGVTPSNLTWEALTKPYGVTHQGGRTHPPYTERGLEFAIERGVDPAGHKLANVMPRYQMAPEDLKDLVAYLRRLGKDLDPGLTQRTITIGTIVPNRPELAGIGRAITDVTRAFFDEINSQGGIYNRRLELKVTQIGNAPANATTDARRFIEEEGVFALSSPFVVGADKELAGLMEELELPVVAPITLYPQVGYPLNRHVFYLLSGVEQQARALVGFAASTSATKRAGLLIVVRDRDKSEGLIQAIKDESSKTGWSSAAEYRYPAAESEMAAFVTMLKQTGKSDIIFLGSGKDEVAFLTESVKLHWLPTVYVPGGLGGNEVFEAPIGFNQKLFFSFPNPPEDQIAEGMTEFRAFAEKYRLPVENPATQILVYSAAKILVEGMKKAGKELSREKLVQSLEGLYEYPTGLTPAITYGTNRRIGAMGSYIVTVDLEKKRFVPIGGWVSVN